MDEEQVFSIRVGHNGTGTFLAVVTTAHGDERVYRSGDSEELVEELVRDLHDEFLLDT